MMIGLFVVGGGIFQTGLAKMASGKLLKLGGGSETKLLIMVMLVTSLIGGFVSHQKQYSGYYSTTVNTHKISMKVYHSTLLNLPIRLKALQH